MGLIMSHLEKKPSLGSTVRTSKLKNRKTALWQYLSVFNVVTKQIVLQETY